MNRDCPDIEDLGALIDLDPHDPRLAHANECARCRNLLASMREFRAPSDLPPEADVREAEEKVGQFLQRELGVTEQGAATREKTPDGEQGRAESQTGNLFRLLSNWRPLLLRPVAAFALVAVAIVVVLTLRQQTDRSDPFVLRSNRSSESPQLALQAPALLTHGGMLLSWGHIADADSYRIVLYDLDLSELARFPAGKDTFLIIAPSDWPTATHGERQLIWQVHALRQGEDWIQSEPAGIDLP